LTISLEHVLTIVLVLARVMPLVLLAPLFGLSGVPQRTRWALGLAIAVLIAPVELTAVVGSQTAGSFATLLGGEALVGVTLGLGVALMFAAMQVAGQLISHMSGLQLAEVFDAGFETSVPVFSQFLTYFALALFLTLGGHRQVLEALLDTFRWLPPGRAVAPRSVFEATTALLTQSFVLGIRTAAPVAVSLLLATLVLGLANRALPQLNLLSLGFGANAILATLVLGISLGAIAWLLEDQLEMFLDITLRSLERVTTS
jgi:flagellar biosynthetic protein FliR